MDVVELVLRRHGFEKLNPVQQEAVDRGLLSDKNMLVAAPTASGKTLIGEIAMIKSVLEGKKAVYLAPLRALAAEKYYYFRESRPEYKVAITTGDYHKSGRELSSYDIIVATYERFDSLIRNNAPRLGNVGVIILDEIHLVGYPKRGPVVEMIVARTNTRLIGLSATIGNPEELAERLEAVLVKSERRPVPLRYGALLNNKIVWEDGIEYVDKMKSPYETIVKRSLYLGGQVLVFREARRRAESLAKKLADLTRRFLTKEDLDKLRPIAAELSTLQYAKEREIASLVLQGVAYHHAGLSREARELIEKAFRSRALKVLVATPTLAAGVNLPARTVVPFLKRYDRTLGISVEIPVMEFRQMAGRAGRPDYDEYGEVIAIVKNKRDLSMYFTRYVYGPPEPAISKLTELRYLRTYVLVAVSEGYREKGEIEHLFSKTLGRRQLKGMDRLIPEVLKELKEIEMITSRGNRYLPTRLGALTIRFYLMPYTVYDAIRTFRLNEPSEPYAYLHLLYFLEDMYDSIPYQVQTDEPEYPIGEPFEELPFDIDRFALYNSARFANILYRRINEEDVNKILEEYRLYAGDFAMMKDSAERIIYSLSRITDAIGIKDHAKVLSELSIRVKYGVREELLELVSLEGVGRVIARRMYNYGIRTLEDVYEACLSGELMNIEGIGEKRMKKICESVKRALHREF